MQSDVSIIMPVHNNEATVEKALKSVLSQTWKILKSFVSMMALRTVVLPFSIGMKRRTTGFTSFHYH